MKDFVMSLKFNTPPARVYDAIMHGNRWWTKHVTVTSTPGEIMDFRFPKAGFHATMKLQTAEPNRLIEWECIDSKHPDSSGFEDLKDWIGTQLRFEISPDGPNRARLTFTHVRLAELECHGVCASTWSFYLNESLRAYLETGAGKPFDNATYGH